MAVAIFNDGRTMTLTLCGTRIQNNTANVHGAAIFLVSNDHTGNIVIRDSVIRNHPGGSWYPQPGISMHDDTQLEIENSILEEWSGGPPGPPATRRSLWHSHPSAGRLRKPNERVGLRSRPGPRRRT